MSGRKALVAVAEITKPHGVSGEMRVRLYNESSELLSTRPPIVLRFPDGTEREERLVSVRPVDRGVLIRLPGVEDRTGAEVYRQVVVCVAREDLPEPEAGEFYACDIEGALVETTSGEPVGRVTSVVEYPTCDALRVDRGARGEIEVPLLEAFVSEVDVERGVVRVTSLEGLEPEAPARPRRPRPQRGKPKA